MRTTLIAVAVAGALVMAPGLRPTPLAQQGGAATAATPAPERIDQDVIWKIRREATERSQIMRTLHVLTDVYGPRLTGSPNLRGAQDWVVQQATAWGLKNAHLEEWDFGHPGWLNERTSVHLVSPMKDTLVVEALAWTPGTPGTITASTVLVTPPERPTQQDADDFFRRLRGNLKGRAVMIGPPERLAVSIDPPAKRRDDNDARAQFSPSPPPPPFGNPPATPPPPADPKLAPLTTDQFQEQLNVFLKEAGAALRINDAGREHGQIRAFNNRTFDVAKAVPTIVMRNEDYGRIARLMAGGRPVSIEATIVNRDFPEGRTQHNVIAEIPGRDKVQEVVMLGGHLDSWHAATGATDNAIGCATMFEAIRILQSIGATPRRTIRLALWSGEEQGLRGSVAYVAQHFGTFDAPKPEYEHFAGYFNIDSGTGRARGYTVFGPPEAAGVLRQLAAPFLGNGLMGAAATRSRFRGGSDHTSFNEVGLPGIGVGQDPIEYGTHSWHTNLDTYERIIESDAQQSAMAIAAAVYHLAMRDEKLPRFPRDQMPPRPGQPQPPPRPSADLRNP